MMKGSVRRRDLLLVVAATLCAAGAACRGTPDGALLELTEARRLAADLRIQFNQAAAASNRAVMAGTDEQSTAFAQEAARTKGSLEITLASLKTHLQSLGYAAEIRSLDEFEARFREYEKIDRSILELAVENTNLKAQRLSFGPAQEAADAFRDALADLPARDPASRCRVSSLVAEAVLAVREIQVLQAPHIAEAQDSVMSALEKKMDGLQAAASAAVQALSDLVDPKARASVTTAGKALDRFQGISGQIVKLSRRNSNVRSLDWSLRQKSPLAAACEGSLRVLQEALAKEGFTATR